MANVKIGICTYTLPDAEHDALIAEYGTEDWETIVAHPYVIGVMARGWVTAIDY